MDTPLVGEALAIDLVNTQTAVADLVATPEQLADWLALERDRLPGRIGEVDPATHERVLEVRGHVTAILRAIMDGRRPPSTARRHIETTLAAAPLRTRLGWDGRAVTVSTRREGGTGTVLVASLAEAAVALLTTPDVARLRECEADDCTLVFVPGHPRRRWCSSQRCGNRARVARHYRNHLPPGARTS